MPDQRAVMGDQRRSSEPAGPLSPFVGGDATRAAFTIEQPPARPLEPVEGLLAGVAEVDITPPPGMPKAGYSANAHDGTGFRTRLRARVIHLRSSDTSLAIVCCDLLGGSAVVQHLVAARIAERTDIALAGVFMGATHTHAGPGQFLSTDFYNRFASNRSGFDPAWTDWLSARIATAVIDAFASRGPAVLAMGSTEVWGLTRNRSLEPHVRNVEVQDRRTDPQRKFVNINPLLHMLRVDRVLAGQTGTQPLGAAVVFSVHGTGVSMHSHEYNADVWGYLTGELSARIAQEHGHAPVVGAMEGTHADVAPAIRPRRAGHLEAQRIGRAIGAEAAALHERLSPALHDDVILGAGLREIDLDTAGPIDGVGIPRRPAVGAALIAGAHENVTPVIHRIPPFRAGIPKPWRTSHPQGGKWVIGTRWLQPIILPLRSFPRVVPLAVLRIDDTALVGLPFEITTMAGRRVESAVQAVAPTGVERVVVSSVANEYFGYLASPEEYDLQHYEGGHTLFGRPSQPYFTAQTARWAGEVLDRGGMVPDVLARRDFDLRIARFLPEAAHPDAGTGRRSITDAPTFTDACGTEDGYWELQWLDVPPSGLRWHEPLVRVEVSDDGGRMWRTATSRDGLAADDQGWVVGVEHVGVDGAAAHRYRARWYDPTFGSGRQFRFVLLGNADRPELCSDPFD